ncbi:hypothetical protein D9757_009108 [Collybiopsis confluens]|uniref:Uncharacterized protein n=1 Tax=Collybiopsis confluens TaxID=2823264 RepID=A0A8H5M387_9AGAR|nr:hypothetical protein D9757_009108 [Collybiopsis confluens]
MEHDEEVLIATTSSRSLAVEAEIKPRTFGSTSSVLDAVNNIACTGSVSRTPPVSSSARVINESRNETCDRIIFATNQGFSDPNRPPREGPDLERLMQNPARGAQLLASYGGSYQSILKNQFGAHLQDLIDVIAYLTSVGAAGGENLKSDFTHFTGRTGFAKTAWCLKLLLEGYGYRSLFDVVCEAAASTTAKFEFEDRFDCELVGVEFDIIHEFPTLLPVQLEGAVENIYSFTLNTANLTTWLKLFNKIISDLIKLLLVPNKDGLGHRIRSKVPDMVETRLMISNIHTLRSLRPVWRSILKSPILALESFFEAAELRGAWFKMKARARKAGEPEPDSMEFDGVDTTTETDLESSLIADDPSIALELGKKPVLMRAVRWLDCFTGWITAPGIVWEAIVATDFFQGVTYFRYWPPQRPIFDSKRMADLFEANLKNLSPKELADHLFAATRAKLHCEAALMARFCVNTPDNTRVWIGVSKKSCVCCSFLAEILGCKDSFAVGTHAVIFPWILPADLPLYVRIFLATKAKTLKSESKALLHRQSSGLGTGLTSKAKGKGLTQVYQELSSMLPAGQFLPALGSEDEVSDYGTPLEGSLSGQMRRMSL